MEYRTVTANQARAEYAATCNEIIEIELVLAFLDQSIARSMDKAQPLVVVKDNVVAGYASNAFWQLLDLYTEASSRRRELYAARDYAYAVWKTASAADSAAGTSVPTPVKKR